MAVVADILAVLGYVLGIVVSAALSCAFAEMKIIRVSRRHYVLLGIWPLYFTVMIWWALIRLCFDASTRRVRRSPFGRRAGQGARTIAP